MSLTRPLALAAVVGTGLVLSGCGIERSSVVVTRSPGSYEAPSHAAAATPAPPGGSYRVEKGDTLYSIAFRNKVDFRSLASWNGISSPYTIWPGQELRLSPPDSAKRAPVVAAVPTPPPSHPSAPSQPSAPPAPQPGFEPVTAADTQPPAAPAPATTTNTPVVVAGKPAESVVPPPQPTAPASAPPAPVENPSAATPIIASGATRSAGGITWRWPADGSLIKKFSSGDAIPGIEVAGKNGDPIRAAADGVVVYSGNGLVGYGELVIIKHSDSFLSAYGHNRKRLVKEGEKVKAGQVVAEMGSSGATRDELQFQIRRDGNPVDPLQYLPPQK
ncbi:peptidoglycan DD-metalloendopeptidase family protein [Luteibacter aegosomatis]|uniref:peptidoglycan DD-metalloendopeptidase family protein n=1 Tax=Luteibacter aegosomatis TaxID=2911537 RepID=UPI001FFA415E|nr:peptidoglycan DD-metalloendopeptidase family protein [Luteibacter aegosomatis]UPG84553.1 peptidoglycan DD-metalloendopeptidase family protein [Luteibacter aegosomatis]